MKYKLRKDLKLHLSPTLTLYRIERLSNGELGGYIDSEKNLSQEGECWIGGSAQVSGYARVSGIYFGNYCVDNRNEMVCHYH